MTLERPTISVILTTDRYETIRSVVDSLREQTVTPQVELIILISELSSIDPTAAGFDRFAAVRVLQIGPIERFAEARATGVRVASAPIVVIGETHSYPHPGWAEALVEAHQGPWAIVAPGFGNANPGGALSWAIFLLDYGRWLGGLPPGEISIAPTHNAAYKREQLLQLGARLETALAHGDAITEHFHARGHYRYFEPSARIDHLNISKPGAWLHERFLYGRLIAGRRMQRWPWPKRLAYFVGSPLIPAVVLSRLRKGLNQARRQSRLPIGTIPAILLATFVSAIGEAVGYALGTGPFAERWMTEYELHKARYATGSLGNGLHPSPGTSL
jgi:Glycosyl transferase family 2